MNGSLTQPLKIIHNSRKNENTDYRANKWLDRQEKEPTDHGGRDNLEYLQRRGDEQHKVAYNNATERRAPIP